MKVLATMIDRNRSCIELLFRCNGTVSEFPHDALTFGLVSVSGNPKAGRILRAEVAPYEAYQRFPSEQRKSRTPWRDGSGFIAVAKGYFCGRTTLGGILGACSSPCSCRATFTYFQPAGRGGRIKSSRLSRAPLSILGISHCMALPLGSTKVSRRG